MTSSDRTKRALVDAFTSLLDLMPYEQITVSTVARACGVSRQAFYYHFHDLEDLIAWRIRSELLTVESNARHRGWGVWLACLLGTLYKQKDIMLLASRKMNQASKLDIGMLVKGEVDLVAMRFVEEAGSTAQMAMADKALMARFYSAGLVEIIVAWVEDGMREPPEKLACRLVGMLGGSLSGPSSDAPSEGFSCNSDSV